MSGTGTIAERLTRVEGLIASNGEQLSDIGVTLDHVVNTIDSILMPTQARQAAKIEEHDVLVKEAHDFIVAQKGAWSLVQRVGVLIAAGSGLVTMVYTIIRHTGKG